MHITNGTRERLHMTVSTAAAGVAQLTFAVVWPGDVVGIILGAVATAVGMLWVVAWLPQPPPSGATLPPHCMQSTCVSTVPGLPMSLIAVCVISCRKSAAVLYIVHPATRRCSDVQMQCLRERADSTTAIACGTR